MADEISRPEQTQTTETRNGSGRRDFLKLAGVAAGGAALAALTLVPTLKASSAQEASAGQAGLAKVKTAGTNQGYAGDWSEDGQPLRANSSVEVVSRKSVAGVLLGARLLSSDPNAQLVIVLDGAELAQNNRQSVQGFKNTYGLGKEHGYWEVAVYFPELNRYLLELTKPIPFGESISVSVKNAQSEDVRASADIEWIEMAIVA